ncbi:hypothetical protein [Actinoallomurus sp. NPDC052274]|uniref:hypothetical protein n=1 Tax=Actinoallomurus sp. NPDC052274 TaxID=3155420 RepID=UPI003433FEDC
MSGSRRPEDGRPRLVPVPNPPDDDAEVRTEVRPEVHDDVPETATDPAPDEEPGHELAVRDETAVEEALEGVVVVQEQELPAILPPWMTSLDGVKAYARWRARWAGHMLAFHAVRTPIYSVRIVVRSVVGTARGVRALAGWTFHAEGRPLRMKAVADGEVRDYLALVQLRNDYVRVRGTVALGSLAGGAIATYAQARMFPTGLVIEALAGLGVAAWWGGPGEEHGILDAPDFPVRLDLNADHLNAAYRAAGLLKGKDDDEDAPRLLMVRPPMRDQAGWSAVVDLPRGGGKTAADALAKRTVIAAELGVDEIQLDMRRVRAVHGGHAARISMWVSDDDPYLEEEPALSPLAEMQRFSLWDPIPFGRDARRNPVSLPLMWQSMFFGGLPRRGKTAAQRLVSAAAALDPTVRHWVADGKGGGDWLPMRGVAHRLVLGAEADAVLALEQMLDEVIDEMEAAYRVLRRIPASIAPDAKLTPQIQRRYGLQLHCVTIDELQEYLTAISDSKRKEALIDRLARIVRRGPAAGFICNFASQRPDADSVPTKLREVVSFRYCTQVIDRTSSDMVLGKGKAAQGADASILSEEHVGVGVLVTGPANFVTVKTDYLDLPAFTAICERGRQLRIEAETLTGDAADDVLARAELETIPQVLSDALTLMRHVERIHSYDLLNRMVNLDQDSYGDWSVEQLADELAAAGVERSTRQVKINGRNLNGYHKSDLEAAAERYETPS